MSDFDDQQKQWLQGFVSGIEARKAADRLAGRTAGAPAAAPRSVPTPCSTPPRTARSRPAASWSPRRTAKRARHPLDRWDEVVARAEAGQFPKGVDVFLTKYHGLFYVAPAQNSFMCRLRIPNGILNAWQMRGLADAADSFGGGYADVTTRANLQIREIPARSMPSICCWRSRISASRRAAPAPTISATSPAARPPASIRRS